MPIFELNIPAGMSNNGTSDQSEMRWEGGSMVRWANGSMEPIGGFQVDTDISGTASIRARKAIAWNDNDGSAWVAYGKSGYISARQKGGIAYDITPTDLYSSPYTQPINDEYVVTISMANWGQNLLMCDNYDRRIYEWSPQTPTTKAVRITTANGYIDDAPINNEAVFVTGERFVFALGADGDPRRVAWCDFEDIGIWTPSSTNQAGDITLDAEGSLRCGVTFSDMNVLLTDDELFVARYVGPPYIFNFEKVSSGCGVISNNAAVTTPAGVFWMGKNNFYVFNGASVSSIPCQVRDSVFNDFAPENLIYDPKKLIWALHNASYNEVWWFYARNNAQDGYDLGSYVIYNYAEGTWATGGDDVPGETSQVKQYSGLSRLPRTCGFGPEVWGKTVWFGNRVFEHEIVGGDFEPDVSGPNAGGSAYSFAMSAPFYISPSKNLVLATQLLQDVENSTDAELWFYTKNYPNDTEVRFPAYGSGTYTLANPTDIRVTGRQFRAVLRMKDGQRMKVGKFIFDVQGNGRR